MDLLKNNTWGSGKKQMAEPSHQDLLMFAGNRLQFSYKWFCLLVVLWPLYHFMERHKWHTQVRNIYSDDRELKLVVRLVWIGKGFPWVEIYSAVLFPIKIRKCYPWTISYLAENLKTSKYFGQRRGDTYTPE